MTSTDYNNEQFSTFINAFSDVIVEKLRKAAKEDYLHANNVGNMQKTQESQQAELIPRLKFLEITGKSESWLNTNMHNGTIPYHRIGRSIFFKMSEVLAFAKNTMKVKMKNKEKKYETK